MSARRPLRPRCRSAASLLLCSDDGPASGPALLRACVPVAPHLPRPHPNTHGLTLAIILGGGAGTRLYPLTKQRAKPAVPIGGAYRLIDVPMSNCINSGVSKVWGRGQGAGVGAWGGGCGSCAHA
jgi:hypothetical protein